MEDGWLCVFVVSKLATNFVSSKLNHLSFRKWLFPRNPGGDSKLWKLLRAKGSKNYHHVDVCGPCQNKPRFPRQPRLNQTKIRQTEKTNKREDDRTGSLTWDGRQHHVPWPLNFVKLAEDDVQPGQGHKTRQNKRLLSSAIQKYTAMSSGACWGILLE